MNRFFKSEYYFLKPLKLLSRGKHIIILMVLLTINFVSVGRTQNVSLHLKNSTVRQALDLIKKQTGYEILYKEKDIKNTPVTNVSLSEVSINDALKTILSNSPVEFHFFDRTIILKEKQKDAETPIMRVAKDLEISSNLQRRITGKVTDEEGKPLVGVSVTLKGTKTGTTTEADGTYNLDIPESNQTLVFSMIGFVSQEVFVQSQKTLNITLKRQASDLDEVIVVAFGTAKKGTFTGAASTISDKVLKNRPITEFSQALTGTTPGVEVGTSNGQPGSVPTVRIRGLGSFNAGNDPLIVLDGIPYDNSLTSINPIDIESITVLKDASSAALYGARGANGVLIINTKKGQTGKPKVQARYNYGLTSQQSSDYNKLNDKDYMELYWEAFRNGFMYNGATESDADALAGSAFLAGVGYNPFLMDADQLFSLDGKLNPAAKNSWAGDTDWYGAITQTGKRNDASVSVSGNNGKTDYYTSLGYLSEDGFILGSGFNRVSANTNINTKATKWLNTGISLNLAQSNTKGQQSETSGANSNPFRATRYMGNILPIHIHNPSTGAFILDENGNEIPDFGSGWTSPDGTITVSGRDAFPATNYPYQVHNISNGFRRQTINVKGYVDLFPIKDLKLTVNGGLGSNMYRSWNGGYVYEQLGNAGSSSKTVSNTTTYNFQQLINYSKRLNGNNFELLLGHESYQYEYNYLSTSMKTQTIPGDNFEYANFTEVNALPNSYTNNYRVEGYFSRLNYDFENKYLFSASFRRDGSSRFYKDSRWGNFWSVGTGWRADKEKFLEKVDWINYMKVRVSYGEVGNDDLSSYYPWRATYSVDNNGAPGYVQSSLGNKNLTWEISKSFDLGVDFELLENRMKGTVDYFHRASSALLFSVPLPISSGIESVDLNAGSMYNQGVEIDVSYDVLRKRNYFLNIFANTTLLKNKLTHLPVDPYTTSIYKIQEGHSRYDFWLRQWEGVNPDDGYNLFKADTANFTFNPGELKEIKGGLYTENVDKGLFDFSGTGIPKATGGFGINAGWENFSLGVNFYYQLGGKFYDGMYASLMTGSDLFFAQDIDLLQRWRKPGDKTNVAKVTNGADKTNIGAATSTRWLTSSNMLELTNINLSYKLPKRILDNYKIADATVYFAADNSWLLTKRKGMYPRRSFFSGNIGNGDVYPPSAVISFGLSVTF